MPCPVSEAFGRLAPPSPSERPAGSGPGPFSAPSSGPGGSRSSRPSPSAGSDPAQAPDLPLPGAPCRQGRSLLRPDRLRGLGGRRASSPSTSSARTHSSKASLRVRALFAASSRSEPRSFGRRTSDSGRTRRFDPFAAPFRSELRSAAAGLCTRSQAPHPPPFATSTPKRASIPSPPDRPARPKPRVATRPDASGRSLPPPPPSLARGAGPSLALEVRPGGTEVPARALPSLLRGGAIPVSLQIRHRPAVGCTSCELRLRAWPASRASPVLRLRLEPAASRRPRVRLFRKPLPRGRLPSSCLGVRPSGGSLWGRPVRPH